MSGTEIAYAATRRRCLRGYPSLSSYAMLLSYALMLFSYDMLLCYPSRLSSHSIVLRLYYAVTVLCGVQY
eukprot:3941655-Rhodomonas_salina.2